jgi:uncharacterized protein (TIGR02266 family)
LEVWGVAGRRVHERFEYQLSVELLRDGEEPVSGETQNISLGGMFVLTDRSLPYGAEVRVRFRLPALKEDTEVTSTVRWVTPDGLGVQFGSLRAMEVWALNQLFKTGGE